MNDYKHSSQLDIEYLKYSFIASNSPLLVGVGGVFWGPFNLMSTIEEYQLHNSESQATYPVTITLADEKIAATHSDP